MAKPALGRGLGALLGGSTPAAKLNPAAAERSMMTSASGPDTDTREHVERVPLTSIRPCSLQPRKDFSEETLRELADSIREQGIIQPLVARVRNGEYELIAGERRWRAAQMVGLLEAPVIVREADDRAVLELALIENLQRENLNPIEEAHGYQQLIEHFELKQEDVAVKVGKSRTVVANALRLLKLDPEIQVYVRDGRLTVGHAKVILGLSGAAQQKLAAERVIRQTLNVRQTEDLVAHLQNPGAPANASRSRSPALNRDSHVADLESRLQERFGTRVALRYRQGKGTLQIHFFTDDDLERVLEIVGVKLD